jgi:hypothetical protein
MSTIDPRIVRAGHLLAEALAVLLAPATSAPDDLLPLADAARVAATTLRVLRGAVRAGDLPAVGKQRDRAVRRCDLEAWISSRRVVHAAAGSDDLDRRIARLERESANGSTR